MSSVLQTEAKNLPITKFVPIRSMCYYDDSLEHDLLIPFTYNEGVLDINIQDDTQYMIDNGTSYDNRGFNWRMVKLMGGDGLVTSLGTNFTTWLSNWIGRNEVESEFTLEVAPVMTRVQQTVQGKAWNAGGNSGHGPINSQYALRFSTEPPASDDYIIAGNSNNNFFSAWVFKTPITVGYTYLGSNMYATLKSDFTNPSY